MPGPLENTKVVEVATMISVPAATHILASYGADVIKVEDTVAGDLLRFYGTSKNGMSGWFANANAGKRSVALDLKSDAGKEIFIKIVADADVVIEGFRSGVMDRLGLGFDALSKVNPNLVYCSASGYGPEGPYAGRPVYDPLIQSLTGWAGVQQVDGQPTLIRAMVADKVGAYSNAQAVMAALLQRSRTGEGCYVQTNMLDSNIAFVWPDVMMSCSLMDEEGVDHKSNLSDAYRLATASDGSVSIAIGNDKQWQAACVALDRPDLLDDERLATSAGRSANLDVMYDTLSEMASKFSVREVTRRLLEAEVPSTQVLLPTEVFDDPQVRATNTVQQTKHPVIGEYRHPQSRSAQFGADIALSPAPVWGEHTVEILSELGFDEEQTRELVNAGNVKIAATQ